MQSNEESKKGERKKEVEGKKYIQQNLKISDPEAKTQKISKVNKKATTN